MFDLLSSVLQLISDLSTNLVCATQTHSDRRQTPPQRAHLRGQHVQGQRQEGAHGARKETLVDTTCWNSATRSHQSRTLTFLKDKPGFQTVHLTYTPSEAPRRARRRPPVCNGTSIGWLCQRWRPALRRCPEQAGETACPASRLQGQRVQVVNQWWSWRLHTGNAEVLTGCEGKPVLTQLTVLLPAVF